MKNKLENWEKKTKSSFSIVSIKYDFFKNLMDGVCGGERDNVVWRLVVKITTERRTTRHTHASCRSA